jgi:hypothetical protein
VKDRQALSQILNLGLPEQGYGKMGEGTILRMLLTEVGKCDLLGSLMLPAICRQEFDGRRG